MRIVLQRVTRATVRLDSSDRGESVASIERGLLLLVGVERRDCEATARLAADKILGLRVFADENGKTNLDVGQVGGEVLVVSQFTLAASLDSGRRPSFSTAAPRELAVAVLATLVTALRAAGLEVCEGRFGAAMAVELINDGPVTFVLDL